jgi:hypothetical protein
MERCSEISSSLVGRYKYRRGLGGQLSQVRDEDRQAMARSETTEPFLVLSPCHFHLRSVLQLRLGEILRPV